MATVKYFNIDETNAYVQYTYQIPEETFEKMKGDTVGD